MKEIGLYRIVQPSNHIWHKFKVKYQKVWYNMRILIPVVMVPYSQLRANFIIQSCSTIMRQIDEERSICVLSYA